MCSVSIKSIMKCEFEEMFIRNSGPWSGYVCRKNLKLLLKCVVRCFNHAQHRAIG